jgi:hypothetical protein
MFQCVYLLLSAANTVQEYELGTYIGSYMVRTRRP